jgi:hypothetical protein
LALAVRRVANVPSAPVLASTCAIRSITRMSGVTSAPRRSGAHRGQQRTHALAVGRIEPQHALQHALQHARGLVAAFEPPQTRAIARQAAQESPVAGELSA